MTKRAVILHGTDSAPEYNWFLWLKAKLEGAGYDVWLPLLPNNHAPDRDVYNDFLLSSKWNFDDNIVVGHSSGAIGILNLLMDDRCPRIRYGLLVSAWDHGTPTGMDDEQFYNLFPAAGFDFERIAAKADQLHFIHSADDPYCPLEQAEYLSSQLSAPLTVMPSGGHLGGDFKELPAVWETIQDFV